MTNGRAAPDLATADRIENRSGVFARAGPLRAWRGLLFILLLFVGAAPLEAQLPPGFEEGIYELRIPGLTPLNLPVLVRADGTIFLPLRPVLEVTGAPFRLLPDSGRVTVARPRGEGEARLSVPEGTIAAPRSAPLPPGSAFVAQGDLYLTAPLLAQLLEADAAMDAEALTVTLTRDVPFPAQDRLAARARRGSSAGRGDEGEASAVVPFVPRTGGGVVEWAVTSSLPTPWIPSAVDTRAGAGLLGGMLRMGVTGSSAPAGGTSASVNASFQRVFPGNRWVRQIQVGDVATGGPRPRSVRGFSIDNAPFAREALFGEVRYAPNLPAGWEYEVYQGGRLLGFSGETGTGVAIPLAYGSTPVEVRLYGPAGERVRSDISYLVPVLQLPAGRWQYSLGGGACPESRECELYSYLDLRRGVTRGLTVFGGAEAPVDSAGVAPRPYGGASILPARGWAVEVQGMYGSYLYATAERLAGRTLSGSGSAGVTYPERSSVAIVVPGGASGVPVAGAAWHADGTLGIRTGGLGSMVRSVAFAARANGAMEGDGERFIHLAVSASLRVALVETAYETTRATGGVILLRAGFPLLGVLPRWIQAPSMFGGVGLSGGALQRWELTATAQPARYLVTASARWHQGTSAPAFSLGMGIPLRIGRAQAYAGLRDGVSVGSMTVSGAAAFGGGAGVRPLRYGGIGLSGITGVVFRDANGNGVLDVGEETAPNTAVEIGSTRVRTDARGRYATWSVLPYEVSPIRLDTTTLDDPAWVPQRAELLLRPSPHIFTEMNFPLRQQREMAGMVVAGPGIRGVGGVTVEFVAAGTTEVQRTLTFSDGAFYVARITPGEYEVRVSESSLRALGARSEPASLRVTVPSSGDQPLVELPPLRLVRAAR
ncbi:MAG TPA: carboxypeptidase-like regulatory domain-containing protein [Longimicrobium sp.]|nr:carboxypeptidase-like regulatory domain-containing protein [Longimicrobium sp.]